MLMACAQDNLVSCIPAGWHPHLVNVQFIRNVSRGNLQDTVVALFEQHRHRSTHSVPGRYWLVHLPELEHPLPSIEAQVIVWSSMIFHAKDHALRFELDGRIFQLNATADSPRPACIVTQTGVVSVPGSACKPSLPVAPMLGIDQLYQAPVPATEIQEPPPALAASPFFHGGLVPERLR